MGAGWRQRGLGDARRGGEGSRGVGGAPCQSSRKGQGLVPTGVYERHHVPCRENGCLGRVIAHSRTGLCRRHRTIAWKKANAARVNAHNRRYNAANAGKARGWREQWQREHPESRAEIRQTRRARKRGAFVEKVYKSRVFKRDDGICGICGEPVDPLRWHLDHVIPFARGGEHSYANTQVSHPACNLRKAASVAG